MHPAKPPRSSIVPSTFSDDNEEASTVIVGKAPPSLEDVLTGATKEKPFDLDSFMKYAERHFFSEALLFLTEVDALRKENNPDKYKTHLRHIMAEFVLRDAPSQINLGHFERLDTEKKASAVLDALSKDKFAELDRTSLNAAYNSILTMVKDDKYSRYCDLIMVQRQLRVSRLEARWWTKEGMTVREFFTFPSPVNTSESRLHAVLVVLLLVAASALSIELRFPWLWLYILYGYALRTLCGPRLDPQAFFVLFVMRPLIVEKLGLLRDEFVAGTPKRFAQMVGLIFVLSSTVLAFLELHAAMLVVSACMFAAASMWAFCGWCIACDLYMVFVRCQMLPSSVCEDCRVRYVKGEGPPVRVIKPNPRSLKTRLNKSHSLPGDTFPSRVSVKALSARFSSQPGSAVVGEKMTRMVSLPFGNEFMKPGDTDTGERGQVPLSPIKVRVSGDQNTDSSEHDDKVSSRPNSVGARLSIIELSDTWANTDTLGLSRKCSAKEFARASGGSGQRIPSKILAMDRKTSRVAAAVEEYNKVFSQRLAKDFSKTTETAPAPRPISRKASGVFSDSTYSTGRTCSSVPISNLDIESAAGVNRCKVSNSASGVDFHDLSETARDCERQEPSIAGGKLQLSLPLQQSSHC